MADLTQQQVVDYIKGISVLELSQLVKELEKELGVSAAAAMPMAMPMGAGAAGGGAAAPVELRATPDPAIAALEQAIATATSRRKLEALWAEHQAIWTNDLTDLASARARLLDAA